MASRIYFNLVTTSEPAKSWQSCLSSFLNKARQPQPIATRTFQVDDRVGVTSQHPVGEMNLRVVTGSKRADQPRLVDHQDAQLLRGVACMAVMVASHQGERY